MAQATRTFRIFVSSTFADLKEERNALQRLVFPRLSKLCLEHQSRFQAIDLRWGVREEAGLDQRTMTICLAEVDRCRFTSPRPNFIVLLGDRYGWRPLPPVVPAAEFDAIIGATGNDADRRLLETWYLRDENADPPEYCLKAREVDFSDARTDEAREAARRAESEAWSGTLETPGIESRLRAALTGAIARTGFGAEPTLKYVASATEQEIERGALAIPDASEHVFGFFRHITNLPADASARDFADVDADGRPDMDARARLAALKSRLDAKVGLNIHKYDATWTGTGASTDHLAQMCEDVWTSLSRVILDEIARLQQIDGLQKERDDHDAFGRDRARLFWGRREILQTIHDYARGADTAPLPIVGASGSGKSAVMARAAEEIRAQTPNGELVLRFIGATPGSSDIRTLLDGLCREISRRYEAEETNIPTDYKELVLELPKRLAIATADRPLVVVLDALDQLSDADRARTLHWLPAHLPPSVRMIVSTTPGECAIALEKKLPGRVVTLDPMPVAEGGHLLDLWLGDVHRRLQPAQRSEVLDKFARGGLPLYLKLAFEESRRWRSYDPVRPALSSSVAGIIGDLFARLSLEANHGPVVVSHGLGYLAAGRNGLTEDEMIDVLSADAEVLRDFKATKRHDPPEERLPVVIWSRLFFDLEPYLTERRADGASLLTFYHRQLREAVEAAFLSGETKRLRHAALATYFGNQGLFQREQQIPNLRRLSELPFQQTNGELWDALYATLTDFDFLEAKCTHIAVVTEGTGENARTIYGGVYELQEDYRRALERFPPT